MKKKIRIRIDIILLGFVLVFCNSCREGDNLISPLSSRVLTTLDRTIVSVPVPSTSPKIYPYEVSKYSQYGYGVWQYSGGLSFQKRLDIMPPTYNNTPVTNTAKLLNFFAMTDIHITDKESPAQAIFLGYKGGTSSAYSGVILYSTQVLDAAVRTINALHREKQFDFGISLGDAVNNSQYNEVRWYIDVLDGKKINPDSGPKDDPVPGPNNDYQDEFTAEGLDNTIKWYQTLGNHDHFWMGTNPPNDYIRQTYIGENILDIGNMFTNPLGLNSRGFYTGSIDGRTPYGEIIGVGPDTTFTTPPKVLAADPSRHFNSRVGFMSELFNTSSNPKGHGFNQADIARGFACYIFEPKANIPIKVIVLDDTQRDDDPDIHGYGHGSLDMERYNWLVNELDKGQAEGKLMIIAAHIPIGIVYPTSGLGIYVTWSTVAAVSEENMIAKLHTYPNLMLWIAGHNHRNTVTALKSPDAAHPELGFWEIETSSLRDFPQQFRTFEIVRNSDNTISIFTTNVDTDVKEGSCAAISRSYAIAAQQIFNNEQYFIPSGSYNAELVKQLSAEMQVKIQNYGTPITR